MANRPPAPPDQGRQGGDPQKVGDLGDLGDLPPFWQSHDDSAIRYRFTKSSLMVTPRPGPSGGRIHPSTDCTFSTVSSCRRGESSTQSSNKKASRQVLSQWAHAATVTGLV